MEFATSKSDSSLFIGKSQNRPVNILVIIDVDSEEIGHVKSQLAASFGMKDLGDLH